MADSGLSDTNKLLGVVLDKLTSLDTKMMTVERELSTVKLDQRRLHDAVKAEKKAAVPGVLELHFPEYDGTDDPAIWLHRCEIFFRLQRTEDDDKVSLAAFHMTGAAQIWYCRLEHSRGVPTWPQLVESVRRRFGAPNALRELAQLRRTGSVAKYQDEFPLTLTEQQLAAHFTAGLRDPLLRAEVELRQPTTLEEAGQLALAFEHRV